MVDTKEEKAEEIVHRPTKGTPVEAGDPVEYDAVNGRPNDTPIHDRPPAVTGSTFADRAKARQASEKRIAAAQNKAVRPAESKAK